MLAHMPGQGAPRPYLRGIAEIFRPSTSKVNYPRLGILADSRFFGPVVGILQRRAGTHGKRLANPFSNALAGHANRAGYVCDGLTRMVSQYDSCSLRFPLWSRA